MKSRKNFDISQFRYFAIFFVLPLASCASVPPAPIRVEVPVMVPCISQLPQRPAYEFDKLPSAATDGAIILALARDWPRGRKYEVELEAVIAGCILPDEKAER
ncbi:hypothetical protein [Janthinobacterium sp. NKUCC08_JDC]|uniref:hypothetical protein n=1 Tax=Janthinobacterium sp. NKUCC08_JDC TaxID=2842122 RepID=UPI001C5B51F2|nr:hypothetical protein [Janthinobacterium sp. NKUCC08_JDC]MBW3498889.1 hypothetical protein [Janthinobacterium sp. NKUCC08_JDC]